MNIVRAIFCARINNHEKTFRVPGSPFSLEKKQALLETISINKRKKELEKILNTYVVDEFNNKTIQ